MQRIQKISLAGLFALAVLGTACSGSPTAPGTLSSERRVQTGGGGGTLCPGACGLSGYVELQAKKGTLSGSSIGSQPGREPVPFVFTARLTGKGDGYDEGFVDIAVASNTATINVAWYSTDGKVFQDTSVTTTPRIIQRPTDAKDCASGILVETTLNAKLQNFGNTTIVETHCAL